MSPHTRRHHLRGLLGFIAGSPYVAAFGGMPAFAEQSPDVIADPKDALSVMDFEEAAHHKVLPGHWAYMVSGVDDDATKVNMTTELFGVRYDSPIFTCPTGGEKSFHPDGEIAVARATKARNTMQMLSTATSTAVEEVNAAHGQPVWYQLYAPSSWDACEKIVKRVEDAGCPVIALTVDNTTGRNSETFLRTRPKDLRSCGVCHEGGAGPTTKERKMYDGIDMSHVQAQNPAMTWQFVDRLRKTVRVKLFIKGIDTHEDAELAVEHGFDGILVSNHGGRSTETRRATVEALPEVVTAVRNRIPVFVDGGVRRGTDVFKALALGAKAVGIGRPCLWGLGAFGEPGVDRVLEILQGELKLVMGNCGTQTVSEITRAYVATPDWRI